jgi:hypothetical protein
MMCVNSMRFWSLNKAVEKAAGIVIKQPYMRQKGGPPVQDPDLQYLGPCHASSGKKVIIVTILAGV